MTVSTKYVKLVNREKFLQLIQREDLYAQLLSGPS